MKIGIIGATGKAGSLITEEAINRHHDVTAIVRNKSKLANKDVNVLEKDLFDLTADDLNTFDVIVNAFNAPNDKPELHVTSVKHLAAILKNTTTRLVMVGGAGSLYTNKEHTEQLKDGSDFPNAYKPTAIAMSEALDNLRKETSFSWLYISPAAFFNAEGTKENHYVLAGEEFTTNEKGESVISYLDYATAFLDQIETNTDNQVRISVRY